MKRILGLDLGTTSIGWALVDEGENTNETSNIVKLGVRVNPLTTDEKTDFEKGRPLSTNAERTLKRGARRNLQRYKLRRQALIETLIINGIIAEDQPLTGIGKGTTHNIWKQRAKAARDEVSQESLAKIFLSINKKRGYKSSRRANNEDEGQAIDGMAVAKTLYEDNLTPGQYVLNRLKKRKKYIPDFYRSDLKDEFKKIWDAQKNYYPNILSDALFEELQEKNKSQTWAICQKPFDIVGIKQLGSAVEKNLQRYEWRAEGTTKQVELEHLAIVLQEINNDLNQSSGYLGAISDRSKELYFNNETVGEHLYRQLLTNPHNSLRNKVFYRQDYLDEFEQIWETQKKFHSNLNSGLKEEIRDVIIFYQRKLKSQKGLIEFCQFESWEQEYEEKSSGKTKKRIVGRRVVPKSSPLFQEFKIWHSFNNIAFKNGTTGEIIHLKDLDDDIKNEVFDELNLRGDLKSNDVLNILNRHYKIGKKSDWKCNHEKIEGNRTNRALYDVYQKIAENEGYGIGWSNKVASDIQNELLSIFPEIGIDQRILSFDAESDDFDRQPGFNLWHLLYSAIETDKVGDADKLTYGNTSVALKKVLHSKYGFRPEYTSMLSNISLQQDYGSLSSKAIRKILPYLKSGHVYSEACKLAGYNHSKSLSAEELASRELKSKLELLKKNSLRNPVVEKILNQMVNLINQVIETHGKPEEVRIELARELKKSAKERADMTKGIADATRRNNDIRKLITKEFGIPNPSKTDVIRYRLWQELEARGFKTLYTNQYIPKAKLFSKEVDIEHVIPKALLFDDSFSNKILAYRSVNLRKGDRTAIDFITQNNIQDVETYTESVDTLFKGKHISKAKRNKLLMPISKLPEDFIERDLRNSQYIAKKAKQMLFEVFRGVVVTSGSITDKLREDWDLINVMKELNMPKYRALGLTEVIERKNNKKIEVIKDWTKRNDHRHHAMDALTVAFTTHNHIQYINNLNTFYRIRQSNADLEDSKLYALKNKITKIYIDKNGNKKRKFIPPLDNFRHQAKANIESILISYKAKNKVVTNNINKTRKSGKDSYNTALQLTPRGQLHKETVYGKIKVPNPKLFKISKRFSKNEAHLIINPVEKQAVLKHLAIYNDDPEVAFATKTLKNNPIQVNSAPLKEIRCFEEIYTIRKDISPDLKLEKVIDEKIKRILIERLNEFGNDAKVAFSDFDKNPIWLNRSKGIVVKRVTIKGVSNAEPLHYAKNHLGKNLLDENERPIPVDYMSTGNNHHVAIYRDSQDKLQEKVVSFFEAVARVNENLPIIDKSYKQHEGWEFQFTLKQNEMFVFPNIDFDPNVIDLKASENKKQIGEHLFRVQKIATKNYLFTHHLETQAVNGDDLKNKKMLAGISYNSIRSTDPLEGIVKVRMNHIGDIVQVGEY